MIVCINKYGRVLHCGDIINYVYIPFNEFAGLKVRLVYPVKTGSINDMIIGIDRDDNYYLNAKGKFTYTLLSKVNSINNKEIVYNDDGLISKIADTYIYYRSSDKKISNIGKLKLEYDFKSKYGEYLVTKIDDYEIKYTGDDEFSNSNSPVKIGKVNIEYSLGSISRIDYTRVSYHGGMYDSSGCAYFMNNRISAIDDTLILYEMSGMNAGSVRKIGDKYIFYYSSGYSAGLVQSYNKESIDYDRYLRIEEIR
jgi:hypothetical protein